MVSWDSLFRCRRDPDTDTLSRLSLRSCGSCRASPVVSNTCSPAPPRGSWMCRAETEPPASAASTLWSAALSSDVKSYHALGSH
jgi:hypothetical protein